MQRPFRFNLLLLIVVMMFLIAGCGTDGNSNGNGDGDVDGSGAEEQPWTYYEFDGIFIFYETDDAATYRQLLAAQFDMPQRLIVRAFINDYYEMDQYTDPYLEAALFLLAKYNDEPIWYCVTMPVTSDAARRGGISIGYPKIMGDISLTREASTQIGTLVLGGKTIMKITHTSDDHDLTTEEMAFFEEIKGLRNLTIVNGVVFDPNFASATGSSGGSLSMPELAEQYPDFYHLDVGTGNLFIDATAAADYSSELGTIFGMASPRIIMSYYFINKFTMRFRP